MSESDIDRITEIVVNKCERAPGDRIGVEEIPRFSRRHFTKIKI